MTDILSNIDEVLDPSRCVLLVIDAQKDFIDERGWCARNGLDVAPLRARIPVINWLVEHGRETAVAVAYVCMEHGPRVDARNYRARYASRGMEKEILCEEGTWGAELDDEITWPGPTDMNFVRHTFDAFAGSSLNAALRERGIETIVATGMVTNVCVLATVLGAFGLGYYVVVAEDGTAADGPEPHHFALDVVRQCLGFVLPAEEIAGYWAAARGRGGIVKL